MKGQTGHSSSHDDAKNACKEERYYEKPRLMEVKLLANQVLSGGCKTVSEGGCSGDAAAQ